MHKYEYRVIPAPIKGQKAKGRKGTKDRFANALEIVMNDQAQEGWRYLRTDTLPCEERHGLSRRTTVYQNMLVFSRALPEKVDIADNNSADVLAPVAETIPEEPFELPAELATDGAPDSHGQDVLAAESAQDSSDAARLGGVTRDTEDMR